jgi:hypothetical protein
MQRILAGGITVFMMAAAGLLAAPPSTNAASADAVHLRCLYADPLERRVRPDRYVIAAIDREARPIRIDDYESSGTTSTTFYLAEDTESRLVGTRSGPQGDEERLVIDRLSGRMTRFSDATRQADKVWNDKKQRIGGFDLPAGKKLCLGAPSTVGLPAG